MKFNVVVGEEDFQVTFLTSTYIQKLIAKDSLFNTAQIFFKV